MPSFVSVVGGDVIKALDPADGGINFFNGLGRRSSARAATAAPAAA